MTEKEWTVQEDEYGTWKVNGDIRIPLEPSQAYLNFKESLLEEIPELTPDEIVNQNIDSIAETVAINTEDSLATAETLAFALEEIMLLKEEIAKLKGGQ